MAHSAVVTFSSQVYTDESLEARSLKVFMLCAGLEARKHWDSGDMIQNLQELPGHCLLITEHRRIGMAFGAVEKGDVISNFSGLARPLILRGRDLSTNWWAIQPSMVTARMSPYCQILLYSRKSFWNDAWNRLEAPDDVMLSALSDHDMTRSLMIDFN
jgi:hypothetical protein